MAEAAAATTTPIARHRWRPGVLPGFVPTLAITVTYLSLLVLIPMAALIIKSAGLTWAQFWTTISSPRALAAYRLSFGGALVAAAVNSAAGLLLAWILVRYRFPGKSLVDGLIDLPLALPTAVAGIALTAIYAPNGVLGSWLEPHGIKIAFARAGVIVAMIF